MPSSAVVCDLTLRSWEIHTPSPLLPMSNAVSAHILAIFCAPAELRLCISGAERNKQLQQQPLQSQATGSPARHRHPVNENQACWSEAHSAPSHQCSQSFIHVLTCLPSHEELEIRTCISPRANSSSATRCEYDSWRTNVHVLCMVVLTIHASSLWYVTVAPSHARQVVHATERTLFCMDEECVALSRIWCLFEVSLECSSFFPGKQRYSSACFTFQGLFCGTG